MMRKQVNVEQRTPEWHAWRGDRIGASDAPVLLKVSPYKTELQLYKEKINKKSFEGNDSMRAGAYYEPFALELACKQLGAPFKPACFDHPTRSYMFASLDGWDESNGLLELKMANHDDHDLAKAGIIPEKYVPQLQDQMAVTATQSAMYGSYVVRDNKVMDIAFVMLRRNDDMVEEIECAAERFYERIQTFDEPEPSEADFVRFEDADGHTQKRRAIKNQIEHLEIDLDMLDDEILKIVGNRNAYLGDLRIRMKSRRGNVEYAKIPELAGVNLDLYRKAGSTYSEISFVKRQQ
jgi:putative phage-type endonuclease